MFKHSFTCLFIFLGALLFTSSLYASESYVVSGNPNAPPIVWEQNQELIGLGPDLTKAVFDTLNIPYTLRRFGNWQHVQDKARAGDIDMIVSAYRNSEREKYLVFSEPYLKQPAVILVEKGQEFDFTSWDSLVGKKGVSNIGESYGQKFDDFSKQRLDISYHQFERAIQLLNLGKADYLIIDLYTALIYSRLLQGEDSVTILDPPVTTETFHIAIRKNSELAKYLPQINNEITKLVTSNEIADRLVYHFDNWGKLIQQRSKYLDAHQQMRTEQQPEYLKEQDQMARQRLLKTMVDREGLPDSAQ